MKASQLATNQFYHGNLMRRSGRDCRNPYARKGVLSPLLANIYLNELDHHIGEKYRMVRYADDCVPRRRIGGRSPPCSYAA